MGKFLAVVATWLMVLVALAQGGPGGSGGTGGSSGPGGGSPTLTPQFHLNNWSGNTPTTNRSTFPAQLPDVEGFSQMVVYPKAGTAQLQIFFRNDNPDEDFVGELITSSAQFVHNSDPMPGPAGTPPPASIPNTILSVPTASITVGVGQTASASITISGLPSFVTKGYIQFQMRIEGNFGASTPGGNPTPWTGNPVSQYVCVTFAPPTGIMVPVWEAVVMMSCEMAQEESTLADVNRNLTEGLFNSNVFSYHLPAGSAHFTWYSPLSAQTGSKVVIFNLSDLLENIDSGNHPFGSAANCVDINALLGILHMSQGIHASGRVVEGVFDQGSELFVTNDVVPIGKDPSSDSQYIRLLFDFHFQLDVSGAISDSSLAYKNKLDASVWKRPAFAWANEGSWQTWLDPDMFGLAYRQHLPGVDLPIPVAGYGFPSWDVSGSPPKLENKLFQTYTITEVQ